MTAPKKSAPKPVAIPATELFRKHVNEDLAFLLKHFDQIPTLELRQLNIWPPFNALLNQERSRQQEHQLQADDDWEDAPF